MKALPVLPVLFCFLNCFLWWVPLRDSGWLIDGTPPAFVNRPYSVWSMNKSYSVNTGI